MDYSAGYLPYLLKAMHNAAGLTGTDIMGADRGRYLQHLELLTLIAMLMKVIQDLHPTVATDAAWLQRLNASLDTGPGGAKDWPGWIVLEIPPEQLAMYGATETDSPAALQAKLDAFNSGAS
jgi:hypothetical protein